MNAVIYARYSSHGQTEQSIEGQLHDAYAWAAQQEITVVGEYIDRALTGTKDARPDFLRMIADASRHQFEMVIVWKLDRFARNRYDSAIYKAKLKKQGVRVVSVKENITDTPEGIILEGLLESMAEYYSANLSQNVKRGQRETIAKGRYCGGSIPYGYKVVDGHLTADELKSPVVKYVFDQYASGVPKKEIIAELNRRGVRNAFGNPVSMSSFQHMLKNPTYTGRFHYRGELVPGVADQLVEDDVFDRVQQRLAATARAPAARKAKVEYLLQGKVFCGHCNAPMVGESGRSHTGATYNYYACADKKKLHTCSKKNEKKEFVEFYVADQTLKYILAPDCAAQIARLVAREYEREFATSRVAELEKQVARLHREMEKLVDAMLSVPKAAQKAVTTRMESLGLRIEDAEADLARLRIASSLALTESDVLAWLHQISLGDPADPTFQRKLIDTFVNSVYLYDDYITIFYNLSPLHQSTPPGSNLPSPLPPVESKFEPVYVYTNGMIACTFRLDAEKKKR